MYSLACFFENEHYLMCGFFLVTTVIFCYRKKIRVGVFKAGWVTHVGANIGRLRTFTTSRVTRVAANHPNKDWRRKHPQDPIDSVFLLGGWEGWKMMEGDGKLFLFLIELSGLFFVFNLKGKIWFGELT